MKHSFLLFSSLLFIIQRVYSIEPISGYIGYKTACVAGAGILFVTDYAYKKHAKKSLDEIIKDFKNYRVQSQEQLETSSNNAIYYAQYLNSQCCRRTKNYIQMNNDPIPENYSELAHFLAIYDFREKSDEIRSTILGFNQNISTACLRVFEDLVAYQEEKIEQSLNKT